MKVELDKSHPDVVVRFSWEEANALINHLAGPTMWYGSIPPGVELPNQLRNALVTATGRWGKS